MYKDPTEWRDGFKRWKETGESPWSAGKRLPKFEDGKENIASTGAYIGAIPFVLRQNDLDTSKNKKVDEKIANKSGYGWDGNSRTIFLNSPAWVKKNINPAWGIIDVNAVKVPFGVQNMSGATKDDNAFF